MFHSIACWSARPIGSHDRQVVETWEYKSIFHRSKFWVDPIFVATNCYKIRLDLEFWRPLHVSHLSLEDLFYNFNFWLRSHPQKVKLCYSFYFIFPNGALISAADGAARIFLLPCAGAWFEPTLVELHQTGTFEWCSTDWATAPLPNCAAYIEVIFSVIFSDLQGLYLLKL